MDNCLVKLGIQSICEGLEHNPMTGDSTEIVCPRLYDDCDGNEAHHLKEERERDYMDKFTMEKSD